MDIYSKTSGKTGENLVPFILEALDDDGLKIYNTLYMTEEQKKSPEAIFTKFIQATNNISG